MRVLMETPCLVVTVDPASSIVRYVRRAQAFPSAAETIRQHVELGEHLDRLRRRDFGLLVDVRAAPFNPSPAFETAIAESRRHLFRGFPRVVILVQSAIGALQLARHVREDGLGIPVLRDEQEAVRLLSRSPDAPPSSRRLHRPRTEPPPSGGRTKPGRKG
jgi:hypothetical protein